MRVLVTSSPGAGHVHPMVPLARALVAAGHEVRWATAADARPSVERAGLATEPAGLSIVEREARLGDRLDEVLSLPLPQRRPALFRAIFAETSAPAMVRDLEAVVGRWPPDLFVHEPAELAAAPVAERLGRPHVTVGFGRLLGPHVVGPAVEAVAPVWEAAGRSVPDDLGLYRYLYLHPLPASMESAPPDLPVVPLRPGGYDGDDGPRPEWLASLGAARPLVYVTFGTEFSRIAPVGEVVDALGRFDVDVLVTTGAHPDILIGHPLPGNVRVEQYVAQRHVLARASLLVSHAGSGAMLGAAAAGLPHLALPLAADQFDNAELVDRCGIGRLLRPPDQRADAIAAAVAALLDDDTVGEAARRVAAEVAAMPTPDDAVVPIETLIETRSSR